MKFGKNYIDLLETSQFLPEWKNSAIEYNKVCPVLLRLVLIDASAQILN